ncbi:arylesterase [Thiorhodospira sibirica]|uniref:arylesterase n=1 Tax=Thiorhodospira sibirica TaxID=154347 RepID=UPI00022C1CF6|nr:arylesterase [Thiorhodospira sibirica]
MSHQKILPARWALLRGLWVLALLLGLWGCSKAPPPLAPLSWDATLLAFGNSLTFGTGAAPEQSYPAQLAQLTGRTVINAGVPGELSEQGLARLPELLAQHQPDLLILTHGGNDLLRRMEPQAVQANLAAMIEYAHSQGVAVVLLGVPTPALLRLRTAPLYHDLARQFAIPLEDGALAYILSKNALKADPIHPNADGYQILAARIHRLLQDAGALD